MGSFVIDGKLVEAPEDLVVTNFIQDGEPHFKNRKRKRKLKHFVLHETCGRTASGCKRTLKRKGYGVQLILARDGTVSCHGDLVRDQMIHANQLNKTSIGIEIVNPYAPKFAKGMAVEIIKAEWWTWCPNKDRRYVLPTREQLKALEILVPWLCKKLGIPLEFPTSHLGPKKRKIKGWRKPPKGMKTGIWRAKPKPGVVAHRDFASHADGVYPLHYLMDIYGIEYSK
jgi:hypothetical protein